MSLTRSTSSQCTLTPGRPVSIIPLRPFRPFHWLGSLCLLLWVVSPAGADDRFYVDLKGGYANFERGFGESHPWQFDDSVFSPSIALGADLHPNLAFEVGFLTTDGATGSGSPCFPSPEIQCIAAVASVEADLDLWTIAVVPKASFGRLTILGRIGSAYYEQRISAREPFESYLGRLTETELLFGAGARIDLTPRLELVLDYERVEVGLDTLDLGLGYRF